MDINQPLLKLGYVQREVENGGAITLNLLTSLEYLHKTKAELSSGHINMIERVKELEWENKCLDHERVMYGGFLSAYIYYVREMKEHLKELNRAWQREKSSSFMPMLSASVADHIVSCRSKFQKVAQKQRKEIRYYKNILKGGRTKAGRFRKQLLLQKSRARAKYAARFHKRLLLPRVRAGTKYARRSLLLVRSSAKTKYARRPQKQLLLPKSSSAVSKAASDDVDFSKKIFELVEEKSGLLKSLAEHHMFAKLVKECSPELIKLQNDMLREYNLAVADGLNFNEQAFDDNLKRLDDIVWWIDLKMARIYAPDTDS